MIELNTYINTLQIQLDMVKQANKHKNGARGEKGKLKGSVILATNVVKLERLVQATLEELAKQGVDIDKCKQSLVLK